MAIFPIATYAMCMSMCAQNWSLFTCAREQPKQVADTMPRSSLKMMFALTALKKSL